MSNTPSKAEIEALVKRHGATSYRNRADTQHPAYGFTEDGLNGLIDEVLAKWGTPAQAAEPVAWAFKYDDGTWHDPSTTEHSPGMRPLCAAPQPAPAPLSDDVVRDAMRFRDLYRMTALLETPAGNAYQDAMESEMAIAFKEAGSDPTKISIEQYRRVIDAGFAAATLAAQGGK